jgi:two-component system, OmpR family, sensor histidine kinase SenX3
VEIVAIAAALLVGAVAGVLVALVLIGRRAADPAAAPAPAAPPPTTEPVPPTLARRVLEVMGSAAVVLDPADEVVLANPAARRMGVVRGGRVVVDDLRRLARAARRDGEARHTVVDTRGRLGREPIAVSARVAPLVESG